MAVGLAGTHTRVSADMPKADVRQRPLLATNSLIEYQPIRAFLARSGHWQYPKRVQYLPRNSRLTIVYECERFSEYYEKSYHRRPYALDASLQLSSCGWVDGLRRSALRTDHRLF